MFQTHAPARPLILALSMATLVALPSFAHALYAGEPEPEIYFSGWVAFPPIPGIFPVTAPTGVHAGDTPRMIVLLHSQYDPPPSVSADFSSLGGSSLVTLTTPSIRLGPNEDVTHFPAYQYSFDLPPLRADVPNGIKQIPITVTDANENTAATTTSIVFDHTPPEVSLTKLSFRTRLETGDTIRVSGNARDADTHVGVSNTLTGSLLDASGKVLDGVFGGPVPYNATPISDALASSTDGTFTDVPLIFQPQHASIFEAATSLRLTFTAYDEAGNLASSTLTVPLPKAPPPSFPPNDAPVLFKRHDASLPYGWPIGFPQLNDPSFFVASGTLASFAAPLAYFKPLTGSEEFSFALPQVDCQTPFKSADEWGITHLNSDHHAPIVAVGPFKGSACGITASSSVRIIAIRADQPDKEDVRMLVMGNAEPNILENFVAYGPSAPPPPPPPPDPCATPGVCVSSVLFLPGIEGSRLYEGTGCGAPAEEKLWEPLASVSRLLRGAGDTKVNKLSLDASGKSVCNDVYVKNRDIIDTAGGSDIYRSLIDSMDALVASTSIRMSTWEPVAYDWRLSLDDLLTKGAERGGRIYYEEATDTPYIAQELRHLAQTSKTGKVTIIAHSNGGLVAKALLAKLGDASAASLVDKLILVGAPQSGAPEDIGSLLVGYNAGIYKFGFPIVSNAAARLFAQNSPMAYHLIPSSAYLSSIIDEPTHPVAHFAGSAYEKQRTAYGNSLVTRSALDDFLLATARDREQPDNSDILDAKILNPTLIAYANATHDALDSWTPPSSIEVDQIAGWGNDTVAGIDFYTLPRSEASALSSARELPTYRPIFVEDGDGTVPAPSALLMSTSSPNVKRFWVNLEKASNAPNVSTAYKHATIFGVSSLRNFIDNILSGQNSSSLPEYISSTQPPPNDPTKKLIFTLHSPLTLQLSDSSGNTTGISPDGSIAQNIPGAEYGQFGETQYLIAPQGNQYQLSLAGQGSGTFSLDIQESSGGEVTNTTSITGVPTTAHTLATLSLSGGVDTASALSVDLNGDGTNVLSIAPKMGETVMYEPPPPPPPQPPAPPPAQASGGGGGGGSISFSPAPTLQSAPAPQPAAPPPASLPSLLPPPPVPTPTPTAQSISTFAPPAVPPAPAPPPAPQPSQSVSEPSETSPVATRYTPKDFAIIPQAAPAKPEEANAVLGRSPQTATVYDAVSRQLGLSGLTHALYAAFNDFLKFITHLF